MLRWLLSTKARPCSGETACGQSPQFLRPANNVSLLCSFRSEVRTRRVSDLLGLLIVSPVFTKACGPKLPRCEQRAEFLEFSPGECDSPLHLRQSGRFPHGIGSHVQNIRHNSANRRCVFFSNETATISEVVVLFLTPTFSSPPFP